MSSHEASSAHHHNEEPRSKSSMSASFWFVIILVGLFIAALNFIDVMGHDSGEGHGAKESTSIGAPRGESEVNSAEEKAPTEEGTPASMTTDTTAHTATETH